MQFPERGAGGICDSRSERVISSLPHRLCPDFQERELSAELFDGVETAIDPVDEGSSRSARNREPPIPWTACSGLPSTRPTT